jgi:hypothetical protein
MPPSFPVRAAAQGVVHVSFAAADRRVSKQAVHPERVIRMVVPLIRHGGARRVATGEAPTTSMRERHTRLKAALTVRRFAALTRAQTLPEWSARIGASKPPRDRRSLDGQTDVRPRAR